MITRELDYALRVVSFISKVDPKSEITNNGYINATTLSEELQIPYRFLRKLLQKMSKVKILVSHGGQSGGYKLLNEEADLTVLDLINSLDNNAIKLNMCLKSGEDCERSNICNIHHQLTNVQKILESELAKITFK